MEDVYDFPHYILFQYVALWIVAEIVAALLWPIRQSCKRVSWLHCIAAFLMSSYWFAVISSKEWAAGRISINADPSEYLHIHSVPGTLEHHVVCLSLVYSLFALD